MLTPTPTRPPDLRRLDDGRVVVLRQLTGADSTALAEAIDAAKPEDLWLRFQGTRPSTSVLLRRLREADGSHHAVIGAIDRLGRIVGVAQFDRIDEEPVAELALEVASGWQRCGLGTELVYQIAELAMERGIDRFVVNFLGDNFAVTEMLGASPYAYVVSSTGAETTAIVNLREGKASGDGTDAGGFSVLSR